MLRAGSRSLALAVSLCALVISACSAGEGNPVVGSTQGLHDGAPPFWGNGTGPAVHHPPVPWPTEPTAAQCGTACGQWRPYTRFQHSLNDPRTQDPSNGGTSPQNYVNIASSCTDRALPSIYYYLHKDPVDPAKDVILFRWRVSQSAHTYATGPSAGAFGSGEPWSSALWTVLFNLDGSGYRTLAAHINGSSGSPSAPVDTLSGIYGKLPTQSINYLTDPDNIKLLGNVPAAFVDEGTGRLLNFQNSSTPIPDWTNGSAETVWDYGTTRALRVSERPCTEYFIDYQIPVALLDATAHGGPKVDRSTPLSMLFCTANSLNNPFQKDCALSRAWIAGSAAPGAFGDFISFDQDEAYAQPIIREVIASAPTTCSETYALTAKIQDALWVDPQGIVKPSVKAASFWSYYDADGDGVSNDGSQWTWAADATLAPGKLNEWRASWDSRGLPRGSYLIGVQAVDEDTLLDDGMVPSGVDNRTFSYVTSDGLGRVYIDGAWRIDAVDFPGHTPALAPQAGENWFGNPLVTGVQVAGTGVDVAINACGIAPTLGLTAVPGELGPGEQVSLAITVGNAGNPASLTVTTLIGRLPEGFTYVPGSTTGPFGSADPTVSAGTLTWTLSPGVQVGPGGSGTLSFRAAASAIPGSYNALANANTSMGAIGSDPVPLTIFAARASLTQTPDRYLVTPDGTTQVTYTLRYTNDSAVTLTGATLTNPFAANLNFVGCSGGSGCALSAGLVTWQLGSLAPGASGTVTLTLTVAPSFTASSLSNLATLRAFIPDGSLLERTSTSTIAVDQPMPALSLAMAASAPRIAPGGSVTWTISYANQGTAVSSGSLLVDTLPTGFAFASCAVSGSPHFTACTQAAGTVTFHGTAGAGVVIAAGSAGTVTLTATAAAAPFTYPNPGVNRATLSRSGGVGSAQAESMVGVTGQYCDFVYYYRRGPDNLLATVRPASLIAPTASTAYSTSVANIQSTAFGPTSSHPDQIVFLQEQPFTQSATLSGLTTTIDFFLGATQGGAATRVVLENASTGATLATSAEISISNGQSWYMYSVVVPANTAVAAGHQLRWVFQFRKPGGTRDITFFYDSVSQASRSSFCAASSPAQLSLSNSVDKAFIAGPVEKLTYRLNYSNVGGTSATSVELTDALAAGMTSCESSTDGSTWQPCSAAASSPPSHLFSLGSLAAGASGTVFVRGNSPASPTPGLALVNTSTLSSTQTTAVTATASTSVQSAGSGGTPSLLITASANRGQVGPGQGVTYSLSVVNVGTAPASNLLISDALPVTAWFNYVPGSITGGNARSVSGNTLAWTLNSLPVGSAATLGFQMETPLTGLPGGLTAVDTFAQASDGAYCTGSPLPQGCTSNTVTVLVDGTANLTLSSAATPPTVGPGDLIDYTLVVQSVGSSTATSVVLRDPLPAHTRFETITAGAGTYDAVGNRVVFSLGDLPSGQSRSLGFRVRVDGSLPAGTTPLANVAAVTGSNTQLRTSTVETTANAEPAMQLQTSGPASVPGPSARLAVDAVNATTLTVDRSELLEVGGYVLVNGTVAQVIGITGRQVLVGAPVNAAAGAPLWRSAAYALSFANQGDAAAETVTVSSTLPSGWLYVAASPAAVAAPAVGANGVVTWSPGTVAAGAATSLQLVAIPTVTGTLESTVADSRSCALAATPGCSDSVLTAVGGLSARKRTTTPNVSVWPSGGVAEYTITLENSLGTALTGISVTDLLPSGFRYRPASGAPLPTSVENGWPTWSGLEVPAQGMVELVFQVDIDASTGTGTYDNGLAMTAPIGVGVTPFDPLGATDEDVTVLGAGTFLAAGYVYRDQPTLGVLDGSDTGLGQVALTVDDGSGSPPYALETDGFGYFRRILGAGSWSVAIPTGGLNDARLSGLILHSAYSMPISVAATDGAAGSLRFGYISTAAASFTVSTSVTGGGSLSPTSAVVEQGETAQFTVTADPGYSLQGVSGCGGALVGSVYTTAAVTADCTVTAEFVLNQYTVSTSVIGGGGLSPTGATVDHGDTAAFTVTADAGYSLQSVSGCGGALVGTVYTTAAVTADCTVTAEFALNQYTVSTSVTGGGSLSPTSATVDHGATATFTVTAGAGYSVQGVSGCGGALMGSVYTTAAVTADCLVTAEFVLNQYTVSTSVIGGGSISPTGATMDHGDTAVFSVTANSGYLVQSVTGCGGVLAGTVYTTAAVTADCTVSATFVLNQYTVSTSVTGGGSLSPTSALVDHGETTTFTVTADAGYLVQAVTGCGGALSGNVYTTAAVTADCTVTATFARQPHRLRLTVNEPLVNACGESTVSVQLVDSDENPVTPLPTEPVTVTLLASANTGTPRIVQVGLLDTVREGSHQVTGRMPAGGATTLVVSLDAADVLDVTWSSTDLPGQPGTPVSKVTFQVGPVDPTTSGVTGNGTQVFAGSGSVQVTVVPRDSCGLDLGPGQLIALEAGHGVLSEVQDQGDGTYTSNFSSPAGACPADASLIIATGNAVTLDQRPAVTVVCAGLSLDSAVTVLPQGGNLQACAGQGEFARVRVIPRDTEGAALAPGQAVTLVESPPFLVGGGVEAGVDEATGEPIYTVLVGSNRCSRSGPYNAELRVGGISLTTRAVLDFSCPAIPEGGVTYLAEPAVVLADGNAASQVRISLLDACGNPGFARSLALRSEGSTQVQLSVADLTTTDDFGGTDDGTALLQVRSTEPGVTGLGTQIDGAWHPSAADLITFVDPDGEEGFYLGGNGVTLGCTTTDRATGGAGLGVWWLALLLLLGGRKVTR